MTLLVFARGYDGFVIVSDRKESVASGQENEIQKYCLPENEEFFLVLAGDGKRAKSLFARLSRPDVAACNVISTMGDFVRANHAECQEPIHFEGFLVTKNENRFECYEICIIEDSFVQRKKDSAYLLKGDDSARLILEHQSRNINFSNLSYKAVAKHLVALAANVAETVSSVGSREEFGFDVAAFLNSGQILQRKRYTEPSERIKTSLVRIHLE